MWTWLKNILGIRGADKISEVQSWIYSAPPWMLCGPRTRAASAALDELKDSQMRLLYKCKAIFIASPDTGGSHMELEVTELKTGKVSVIDTMLAGQNMVGG